jgi:hypothetical protein
MKKIMAIILWVTILCCCLYVIGCKKGGGGICGCSEKMYTYYIHAMNKEVSCKRVYRSECGIYLGECTDGHEYECVQNAELRKQEEIVEKEEGTEEKIQYKEINDDFKNKETD